jgi:hypothetical protein
MAGGSSFPILQSGARGSLWLVSQRLAGFKGPRWLATLGLESTTVLMLSLGIKGTRCRGAPWRTLPSSSFV